MKLLTVLGARPQFIKAGALSREIKRHSQINEIIVHTGQHYDPQMSDVFFEELELPLPNYHLNINQLSHGAMTGRMLEEIEKIILKEQPDCVLVYGDTNSTLAGALAAKKIGVAVAHVEAGLRSYDLEMPEEINRILTDRISDLLFCPTIRAVNNLESEGFAGFQCKTFFSGDVMLDAALYYAGKSKADFSRINEKPYALCTIHRQENTGDTNKLRQIFAALERINEELKIIMPLHPRTLNILKKIRLNTNVEIITPLGYIEMLGFLDNSQMVLTDSGGLQKESYFFGKPCITLRDTTEWTELLECGSNKLAGADTDRILAAYDEFKNIQINFDDNLYGNGRACKNIVEELINELSA